MTEERKWPLNVLKQKGELQNSWQKVGSFNVLCQKSSKRGTIFEGFNKVDEATNISNYINIETQQDLAKLTTKLTQIFHIENPLIHKQLASIRSKLLLTETYTHNPINPQTIKIEACYSSKWRETQQTIFLLIRKYTTRNNKQKVRVILLNKRGLVVQTMSNLQVGRYREYVGRVLSKSYSKLVRLWVLGLVPQGMDLQLDHILKSKLKQCQIMFIGFGSIEDVYKFKQIGKFFIDSYKLRLQNINRESQQYGILMQQNMILYGKCPTEITPPELHSIMTLFATIIKREHKVDQYFNCIEEFNSTPFFIRLFAYYHNFIAIESLDLGLEQAINTNIITKLLIQLQANTLTATTTRRHDSLRHSDNIGNRARTLAQRKREESERLQVLKCYQQMKQGWSSTVLEQKQSFEQFVNVSFKNLVSAKINEGMNLFKLQQQLINAPLGPLEPEVLVKKQEQE